MMSKYNPDLSIFQEKITYLDAALTDKPWRSIHHTALNQNFDESDFIYGGDPHYYLSDGGYSRIGYNIQTGELYLTSNSLDYAKLSWSNCKELISDVEIMIRDYYIKECQGV